MAKHHIGTSGWSYDHWHGPFYPAELPPAERLAHYAGQLASVEIDNTFYQLPSEGTLVRWREAVPAGFVFATKASRYITHMKKLKDEADNVPQFVERLERFLDTLDHCHRWAFELRDRSWIEDNVLALLESRNAAFCIYELDGYLSPAQVTADFVYVRLHGPDGAYRGRYDDAALDHWAARIRAWTERGLDVYCYFDNDEAGYAVLNAQALAERLGEG